MQEYLAEVSLGHLGQLELKVSVLSQQFAL